MKKAPPPGEAFDCTKKTDSGLESVLVTRARIELAIPP